MIHFESVVDESHNPNITIYNGSNHIPDENYEEITPLGITSLAIQISIVVLSVICNSLVIATIVGYRRLHNNTNYLVVNQCVVDFLFATLIIAVYPIQALLGYWPFIKEWCAIHYCLSIGLVMVSILNLCAISFDRYIAICHPYHHPRLMTKKSLIIILLFVWIQPLLISLLPIMLWRTHHDLPFGICSYDINRSLIQERVYLASFLMINYVIPAFIMLLLYSLIFRTACRQVHQINKQNMISSSSLSDSIRTHKTSDKDIKLVLLFLAIVGTLYICWTPLYTLMMISYFDVFYQPHIGTFVAIMLAFSNCAINPIIYSCSNAPIRKGLFKLVGIKVNIRSERYVTTV
ncbi:uncharacterized protein TRIADDRAFT_60482 [Trichoplax adhaerens]|uniref:G-protein coupled receptors family 1 profile domain-containing protein n=1 Tax=Trichoplax adhaerens TaxID=10228 RepID=B3S8B9_TRIAD|nr:hypothetical protein TRIADDRAFT_60482 [Trichoplax adhaerens]EDV21073.1 hypothetical protein TRIADDRAFT_60482 [Trichoplax adhaerens]|eukprot:XP_002116403.1 hypothetical protein TRIADDRAFT_60482 [Trichoplax adhaerens]